jgi:hypothetical protein
MRFREDISPGVRMFWKDAENLASFQDAIFGVLTGTCIVASFNRASNGSSPLGTVERRQCRGISGLRLKHS